MTPDIRRQLQALGPDLTPDMMRSTQAIFAEAMTAPDPSVRIERDIAYGDDERHRLDIFRKDDTADAPVLVFVHGGGFVMGDKRAPGQPFYDNIGSFAAAAGMIGVTMNYRLAPANGWPAGPEDLGKAVGWLRSHIARYGGNPNRIYIMGQSAGAVHVASYVAHRQFHAAEGGGIAGALMISCIYDVAAADANPFHRAYYGEDETAYPAASTQDGLIASDIPLLMSVSEFDIADFQKQAAVLVGAWGEVKGAYPHMLWLHGHNHLSPVLAIGTPADALGPQILSFIAATTF